MNDKKEKDIQDLIKLRKEATTKEYEWAKKVVTAIGVVFGIIVSLKRNDVNTSDTASLLFVIAIISNATCILSGLIYLYGETNTLHRLAKKFDKYIASGSNEQVLVAVKQGKLFQFVRIVFFISLLTSIISLTIYATHHDFRNLIN